MKVRKEIPKALSARLSELASQYGVELHRWEPKDDFTHIVTATGTEKNLSALFGFLGEPIKLAEVCCEAPERKKYCRSILEVEAVQVTAGTTDAEMIDFVGYPCSHVPVGCYVVKFSSGRFTVMQPDDFRREYEPKDAISWGPADGLAKENDALRKALDEANKRAEVADKVIADKNARRGMTLAEYQKAAMTTCLPTAHNPIYMLFGMTEEVGELAGLVSKGVRKGDFEMNFNGFDKYTADFDKTQQRMKKEAGDVLWMLSGLCSVMGWDLDEIASMNLDKLAERAQTGTIEKHQDH